MKKELNYIFLMLTMCTINGVAKSFQSSDYGDTVVRLNVTDVELQIEESTNITISFRPPLTTSVDIFFTYQFGNDAPNTTQEKDIIKPLDNLTNIEGSSADFFLVANLPGSMIIGLNSSSDQFKNNTLKDAYVRVSVVHSHVIGYLNVVIGWLYFVAWTVSFYPQVYKNYRRKSVDGLNFDFLALNITGFLVYSAFNIGLYYIPQIQEQYHDLHPRGVNPVELNDVIFGVHAFLISVITAIQCCIYERGDMRVSRVGMGLLALIFLIVVVTVLLAVGDVITWLSQLYYFSYIKLAITLIKYVPQAVQNCSRWSTEGWAIGNVLCDFTGGSLSLVQMALLAYNSDDWTSLYGNPTKLGLGLFSMAFDVLFMAQHYCCFTQDSCCCFHRRQTVGYESIPDSDDQELGPDIDGGDF